MKIEKGRNRRKTGKPASEENVRSSLECFSAVALFDFKFWKVNRVGIGFERVTTDFFFASYLPPCFFRDLWDPAWGCLPSRRFRSRCSPGWAWSWAPCRWFLCGPAYSGCWAPARYTTSCDTCDIWNAWPSGAGSRFSRRQTPGCNT